MAVNPALVQFSEIAGYGEIDIDAAAEQLPSVAGKVVYLKALGTNTGIIYIGKDTNVTASDGSTDTTTGYALSAGHELGPFPLTAGNLSGLWAIAGAANQVLSYLVLK